MCQIFSGIAVENYQGETRSMRLAGHATSVRLEAAFWRLLERLAEDQGTTLGRLLSELHAEALELHGEVANFASLLRCVCLLHVERASGDPGLRLLGAA